MEQQILNVLASKPWSGMKVLTTELGEPAAKIRETLKTLMEANKVDKVGNRRSTKYALAGANPPENKLEVSKEDLFDYFQANEDRKISRKDIADHFKTYDIKIAEPLMNLVEEGLVNYNGKKRGQLFWIATNGTFNEEILEKKVGKVEVEDDETEEEPEIQIENMDELVRKGLSDAQDNIEYTVVEISDIVYRHAKHPFTPLDVSTYLSKNHKNIPYLHAEMKRGSDGYRAYYRIKRHESTVTENA